MYRSMFAGFVAAAVLSLAPALAQSASVVVSGAAPNNTGIYQTRAVTVNYGDLDVSTAPGAAALLDRIGAAARAVCGERAGHVMEGVRARVFEACRTGSVSAAVAAVNVPQLTQAASH